MSEIKSNFRISLIYSNWPPLARIMVFKRSMKLSHAVESGSAVFSPIGGEALSWGDRSANLAFQNTPDTIVERIAIRRFWSPLCGGKEAKNLIF